MPASVDSIPSSQGQEDHVSMGSNAATKLYRVVLQHRAGAGHRAVQRRAGARLPPSGALLRRRSNVSSPSTAKRVPFIDNDSVMYPHIEILHPIPPRHS